MPLLPAHTSQPHTRIQALETVLTKLQSSVNRGVEINDPQIFASLLETCFQLRAIDYGIRIHHLIPEKLLRKNAGISAKLLRLYAYNGQLEKAHQMFDVMPDRTSFVWNSLISGYVDSGLYEDALALYFQMIEEGVDPDQHTFPDPRLPAENAGPHPPPRRPRLPARPHPDPHQPRPPPPHQRRPTRGVDCVLHPPAVFGGDGVFETNEPSQERVHFRDGEAGAVRDRGLVGERRGEDDRNEVRGERLLRAMEDVAGDVVLRAVPALKVEDQVNFGKRYTLVGSVGAVKSQQEAAYGANFELQRREIGYPIGPVQSTVSMSLIKWRGDLAMGLNLLHQLNLGRNSKVAVRVGINNKMSGQVTVKTSSSEHLSIALAAIVPTVISVYRKVFPSAGENYHVY